MSDVATVVYAVEQNLPAEEFIDVLRRSTLAERRPVDDRGRVEKMVANADLTVTARVDGKLVGVARSITDWAYCLYCSDLAVDEAFQGHGIGRELLRRTRDEAGPGVRCYLFSAPKAMSYYPHIGLQPLDNGFAFTDI